MTVMDRCAEETIIYYRGAGHQRTCDYPEGHDGPHEWSAEIWAQGWTAGYLDGTTHPGNPFEVTANPYIKEDR